MRHWSEPPRTGTRTARPHLLQKAVVGTADDRNKNGAATSAAGGRAGDSGTMVGGDVEADFGEDSGGVLFFGSGGGTGIPCLLVFGSWLDDTLCLMTVKKSVIAGRNRCHARSASIPEKRKMSMVRRTAMLAI
ncbi:hypothetical protein RchiOBHm_Chr6g0252061 [Rosa chinensis]|uniref:Uncharacterized protein n=1 Tax=Rosa chinensis TaxID=74649 RepID=A0A2P6PKY5_ROSCH|nr:hypothetical protein RchiOBHm_Chr6g0252061 [Rosa chinensis]